MVTDSQSEGVLTLVSSILIPPFFALDHHLIPRLWFCEPHPLDP